MRIPPSLELGVSHRSTSPPSWITGGSGIPAALAQEIRWQWVMNIIKHMSDYIQEREEVEEEEEKEEEKEEE